jgi:hypothetical protein
VSLVRQARDVDGPAAPWDYLFRCQHALEENLPFPVEHPPLGPLRPLRTAAAMRHEARIMQNCLARCIPQTKLPALRASG